MIKKFGLSALLFIFTFTSVFANELGVDCLILEDENSIVCKYTHVRVDYDKNVTFNWIDPNGNLSRSREMVIPAFHGSVYDYRYKKGRVLGTWTFEVIDQDQKYTTNFTLE